jgi:hypothetical protein
LPIKLKAEYARLAEQILAQAWGGPVRLGEDQEMKGSKRLIVYRCAVLEAPAGNPVSVIIKQVNYSPPKQSDEETAEVTPALITKDWAGLAFLNELNLAEPLAPRFYGGSMEVGLMVLEDLGGAPEARLDHLLQGDDSQAAEAALLALMRSVGRLHALTAGKEDRYLAILKVLGMAEPTDFEDYSFAFLRPQFEKVIATLEVTPQPGVFEEIEQVYRILSEPEEFLAYVHGDPCPDNCLLVDERMRLFDFELSYFRHALLDGAYSRFHFPTCWCVNRLPEDLWRRMENAYRAELVKGCPAVAEDDAFYTPLIAAGIGWSLALLEWENLENLFEKDKDWGISTVRQRVLLRFDMVARSSAELGLFPALGASFGEFYRKLRGRWVPETAEMPLYPAFRSIVQAQ